MISPYSFFIIIYGTSMLQSDIFLRVLVFPPLCFSVNSRGLKIYIQSFLKPDLKAFSISFNVIC